ncbi:glycoside hydrolase family 3 protein [Streptomyces chumphonensis]|uniref:glycoside hydrolase family 3 protein n=1 Tax=Streptomyces chumphonensis TaxID=1214925 RepID=UPI003D7482B9
MHGRQQPAGHRFRRPLTAAAAAGALLLTAAPALAGDGGGRDGGAGGGWVDRQLSRMSLEEKVGQLFVTYAYGETADTTDPDDVARNRQWLGVDNGREAVEEYHLGGVVYFAWSDNLREPRQVAGLSNGLQEAALDGDGARVPLLISTDQEHGVVSRLGPPATQFPGNMALGASGRTADARKAAKIAGRELRAVGVNQNYAPVADVNVNPANPVIGVRSFSGDPHLAAELTAAQVEGYQSGRAGVAATAKHFPGHGDTDVDSHTDLPVIHHTLEEWREIDAPPFREAVRADVGAIMTAHIQFPELDPSGAPATLSEPIMTGLLREELGYDGVVVTDSLSMAGVRETYPDAEVPVRALRAGVDLLLMPPDLPTAYDAVLDAVTTGELTEERIDRSVRRVLELKHDQGIVARPFADVDEVAERVGPPRHLTAAQRISDRTTTLVKNDDGLLPLADDGGSVLVTGWGAATTARLAERIDARAGSATAHWAGSDPTPDAVDRAVAAAEGHDAVVVTTSGTATAPGQARLVRALLATGKPVVTVAVGRPYDIAHYPQATTHLATYSYGAVALESATRVLFGEVAPRGTLPVMIPTADDPGEPLFPFGHGLGYRR